MIIENVGDLMALIKTGAIDYVLPFVAVIAVLVFVHEMGHYLVARLCGVRVEAFSIGFGPELYGWNDTHGTRWKICALPLGGYVQMFGDADPAGAGQNRVVKDKETGLERPMTDTELSEAFFSKPVSKRAAIVAAGPIINFLFAILVLACVYLAMGKPVTPPVISAVIVGSGGEKAGLQPGDRIVSLNGEAMERFSDVQRFITLALDTPITVVYDRNGQRQSVTATAERQEVRDRFGFAHERGMLGVIGPNLAIDPAKVSRVDGVELSGMDDAAKRALLNSKLDATIVIESVKDDASIGKPLRIHPKAANNADFMKPADNKAEKQAPLLLSSDKDFEFVSLTPVQAVVDSVKEVAYVTVATLQAMGQMVTGVRSPQELGGLIRIGAIAGDAASGGIVALLVFAAMLSVNLGLINFFPIPMLDGGHLVFYAIESAMRRPVPAHVQNWAFRIGFGVLICLMLFSNLNDVYQLVVK